MSSHISDNQRAIQRPKFLKSFDFVTVRLKGQCHEVEGEGELVAKFAAGVVDTGGNLPPVSLTPVANLPPVSTAQGELVAKFAAGIVDTGGKFATGVNSTKGTGGKICRRCC